MASPTSLQTYPNDNDTGIPIGIELHVVFDRGIDLSIAKHNVVLYGKDFDMTSGPDSALWIDQDTGNNPYFLKSPGFSGFVDLTARVVYVDLNTGPNYTEVDPGTITSEADETGFGVAGIGHKLILTPANPLAPDVDYTFNILGDPNTIDTGISSRTVFDVVPDGGNGGSTGIVYSTGGYTRSLTDTVEVKITTGGNIGTAQYKWWYTSEGEGSARLGKVTSRRFRLLEDGLQIRFGGSGFVLDDLYTFNVEPIERMATSFVVAFQTNDGTYTTAPASPSTPAPSLPPASVIPPAPGDSTSTSFLTILDSDPENGSYGISLDTRQFTIQFSDDLDASTVTDASVRVFKYPVSGVYEGQPEVEELAKKLTVSGDTLTIEI